MKLYNIPLDQIVSNPWRDLSLYPLDDEHVADLKQSITDHGFFSTVKGRRANGKVEIGCGHTRVAAARKAKLETVPIFVDDIDDDGMVRLMTDENALQSGTNPGAVMNEVAAVTRRLIEGLLQGGSTIVEPVAKAFENKAGIEQAQIKLRKGTNIHIVLGEPTISRYLGQGNADRSHRGARQIREAISALKQSGKYQDIVEEAIAKYAQPVDGAEPAKEKAIARKDTEPRRRILDERCANVFTNDHQFHAFRESITTQGAQKVIPVDKQHALAKRIMSRDGAVAKQQVTAMYIKRMVQVAVADGLKEQRDIDKTEREQYLAEQREARIDDVLTNAKMYLRSLTASLMKLCDLADEFPAHPKIAGFSERLKPLRSSLDQLEAKLDPRKRR